MEENLFLSTLELIKSTSCGLSSDVLKRLTKAQKTEEPGSIAQNMLAEIIENEKLARSRQAPLCQDTGSLLFKIQLPKDVDQNLVRKQICRAVEQATKLGYLRENAVCSLTGVNSNTNLGKGSPNLNFIVEDVQQISISLMLKGGGSENVSRQYSLPNERLSATRDLEGVRKVVLDGVFQAQGKGCAPGWVGVAIGGDRISGLQEAKKQFWHKVGQKNPDPQLDKLEKQIIKQANQLGIGPMGLGGKTTLLGCKIDSLHRVPASFFVSISYMCWAFRRQGISLNKDLTIKKWLYK